jgi:hypothetical protein
VVTVKKSRWSVTRVLPAALVSPGRPPVGILCRLEECRRRPAKRPRSLQDRQDQLPHTWYICGLRSVVTHPGD